MSLVLVFFEGAVDWFGRELFGQDLGRDAHQIAAPPAVDIDLLQRQDALFHIHRQRLARAERRGAADLVAGMALGDYPAGVSLAEGSRDAERFSRADTLVPPCSS